eukprot:2791556-Prymnesium_polylepis.1
MKSAMVAMNPSLHDEDVQVGHMGVTWGSHGGHMGSHGGLTRVTCGSHEGHTRVAWCGHAQ